jgi:hypothetical protein
LAVYYKKSYRLICGQKIKNMSKAKTEPLLPQNMKDTQAEAQRYFSTRGSRTTPARAKALLMRMGTPGLLRDDDRLNATDED